MSRPPRSLLVPAILALALLAGGGGGGGEGPAGTAASSTAQASIASAAQKQPSQSKAPPPGSSPKAAPQHTAEGDPTPGSKAVAPGVPVVKGGDNSVQAFGTEAEAAPREQATVTLETYLRALRDGDWGKICEVASAEFRRNLAEFVAQTQAEGTKRPAGCAEALEAVTARAPKSLLGKVPQVSEVLSFRIRGKYAYLIYRGSKGPVMFIAMADDDGRWKVNVLKPEPFADLAQGEGQ